MKSSYSKIFAVALLAATVLSTSTNRAFASGGGGNAETIKISKCFFSPMGGGSTYCEMLIKASSTNGSARLFAYNQAGSYIGEVQNGAGGRYGGSVFVQPTIPTLVTIVSTTGASASAVPTPFVQ